MRRDFFLTGSGMQVPAVTADQMRSVDRIAVESGLDVLQMMENAGRSLATIATEMHDRSTGTVVVLAGRGGNGGGGIGAARHLANHGVEVAVVLAYASRLDAAASAQMQAYRLTGAVKAHPGDLATMRPGLVIDALIGYGLAGPPSAEVAGLISWANGVAAPVLALDVPSGVDATTGDAPGAHVSATVTVTLALPKTGLGSPATGELWLADIGIPAGVYRAAGLSVPAGLFASEFLVRLDSTASVG